MRSLGVLAALLLAGALSGCGTGPAPGPPPGPPPDVLLTVDASGARHLVSVRAGAPSRDLPPGALAARLTGGGDLGETYIVSAGGTHTEVLRVVPARGFATEVVADLAGAGEPQAALVPAPQLNSFVGAKTVLVVRFGDGRLTGFQAGNQIWSLAHPEVAGRPVTQLVALGGAAAVGDGVSRWGVLVPESGQIRPVEGCEAGPLAAIGEAVIFSCRGELDSVPALGPPVPVGQLVGVPWVLAAPAGGVLLVWPGGDFLQLDRRAQPVRRGRLPAPGSRPRLTPDGGHLVFATEAGILVAELSSQRTVQLVQESAIDALALSRDGNFIYVLHAGQLEVFTATGGRRLSTHPAPGLEIELVAGG